MSQSGVLTVSTGGGTTIETITGNSGGPVPPDAAHNFNLTANTTTGLNTVGNAGLNTINIIASQASTSQFGTIKTATQAQVLAGTDTNNAVTSGTLSPMLITKYVVGTGAAYTTIQSALDAANAAGGGVIYLRPGTYTENLTLYGNTQIVGTLGNSDAGTTGNTAVIVGVHTPPLTNSFTFANTRLESATDIFNSNAAGSSSIVLLDVLIKITNGYLFNLPNWTGVFVSYNVGDISTNNGMVNNTGGATCFFVSATHGQGTANTMVTSGPVIMQEIDFDCPWNAGSGTQIACDYNIFTQNVTCSGNSTGNFSNCKFLTGTSQALTMNSSANVILEHSIIETSNNPAIGGNGAGTLTIADVTYHNNKAIAGTVTTGYTYPTEVGTLYAQNISFNRGTSTLSTNGQLIIGNTGNNPSISTLTAGAGISITNGAGSITIASTSAGATWSDQSGAFAAATDNGYFITGAATATLPAAPAIGDTIQFIVDTASTLTITANAGQSIRLGGTISGVGGTCASNARGDSITLTYRTTGATWFGSGAEGTWTIT